MVDVCFSFLVDKVLDPWALCESLGPVDGMEVVVSGRLRGGSLGGCRIGGKKVDTGTRMVDGAGIGSGRCTVRVPGECVCVGFAQRIIA